MKFSKILFDLILYAFSYLITLDLYQHGISADFFPMEYFPFKNFILGFLGNFAFSIALTFRHLSTVEKGGALPIKRLGWMLIILRPFGAATFNFCLAPLIRVGAGTINPSVENAISGIGGSIILGLLVGYFFEYIITKAFTDNAWNKITQQKNEE